MDHENGYPKLARQPLTLVLAEFRFSPVEASIPKLHALQERLRDFFPDVHEYTAQTIRLGAGGQYATHAGRGMRFRDREGARLAQVESERLIYVTTRYPRFPAFSDGCLDVVDVVRETLEPRSLHRVGLRYNDAVVPQSGEGLNAYLDPCLLPPECLDEGEYMLSGHRTETQVGTPAGRLAARALIGCHGLAFMPDITRQFQLEPEMVVPRDRPTAVLDFDHFWSPQQGEAAPFSRVSAGERLGRLHQPAREAFWRLTTTFAREERWS